MSRHRSSLHRIVACALVAIAACTARSASAQTSLCCPADLTADTEVGSADLALLLSQWGGAGAGDLDGDGATGARDLAAMLGAWGACPSPCLKTRVVGTARFGDGTPAANASVVTSFGGVGVASAKGGFAFVTDVPEKSTEITVTAIRTIDGTNYIASTVASPVVRDGTTDAGTLTLVPQAGCVNPQWLPSFGMVPGLDDAVFALTIHDDGSGPMLYIGGSFRFAGTTAVSRIARWNGRSWSAVGGGFDATVFTLLSHDDGSGPRLYAGGSFSTAGGVAARRIARWDGASWSPVGSGMSNGGSVKRLAVYDSGSGPQLYAAGVFSTAGGVPANGLARWNGAAWSAVGWAGGTINALLVHDDGAGPMLYAGGSFTSTGSVPANGIARWNGATWSAVGSGVTGPYAAVHALCVHDAGSGPKLFVGGNFTAAGDVAAQNLAYWDGAAWRAPSAPALLPVVALASHDDGSGLRLTVASSLTAGPLQTWVNQLSSWNGKGWTIDPKPPGGGVNALLVADDGGIPTLVASGQFTDIGGQPARRIARLEPQGWRALGGDVPPQGLNGRVNAFAIFDDGHGPRLYAGGKFRYAGLTEVNSIARWDGDAWSPVGGGVDGEVFALAVYDDGTGAKLYAGGTFGAAGGAPARRIARWDGKAWSPLGSGVFGGWADGVLALAVYDSGTGPQLYVAGYFTSAGGVAANQIARWNGTAWSALASGTTDQLGIVALAVHDDGSGPKLYAGGGFSFIGGVAANRIASWNGSVWRSVGGGTGGFVRSLAVFDDGAGPKLYAGGLFSTPSLSAYRIARWNGSAWSGVGTPGAISSSVVSAFAIHNDGSGPKLYASFTNSSNLSGGLLRLDGSEWVGVGTAVLGPQEFEMPALISYDDGSGRTLYMGGGFEMTTSGDAFITRLGCLDQ
ncbi:MAG: hypothetical protein NTU45_15865 [Planctomycetota bacterium]|nr:hypothetical protein [Planctomycetota bacterium]